LGAILRTVTRHFHAFSQPTISLKQKAVKLSVHFKTMCFLHTLVGYLKANKLRENGNTRGHLAATLTEHTHLNETAIV